MPCREGEGVSLFVTQGNKAKGIHRSLTEVGVVKSLNLRDVIHEWSQCGVLEWYLCKFDECTRSYKKGIKMLKTCAKLNRFVSEA